MKGQTMWDKLTMWITMHILIPIYAIILAYHTLNEEVKGQTHGQQLPGMLSGISEAASSTVPDGIHGSQDEYTEAA